MECWSNGVFFIAGRGVYSNPPILQSDTPMHFSIRFSV
jgi:hypothetical protein